MPKKDKGMRWFHINYVREVMKPLVDGPFKTLAQSALSDAVSLADPRGVFTMSSKQLAGYSNCDPRSAQKALKTLKDCGAIVLHNSSGKGGFHQMTGNGIANRYRINFKMPGVTDDQWDDLMELCGPALKRMMVKDAQSGGEN